MFFKEILEIDVAKVLLILQILSQLTRISLSHVDVLAGTFTKVNLAWAHDLVVGVLNELIPV